MPRVLGIDFETDFRSTLNTIPGSLAFVLIGMLLVDAAFILVSANEYYHGVTTSLHVSRDNGVAEHFQYLKWGLLALLLGYLAFVKRASSYFAWALLFLYLLIDDSQQIHETYGARIAEALALQPALWLRPQDFGELAVTAIAAVPLSAALGLTYLVGSGREERIFTHTMVELVIALAFFGVGFDMLGVMVPWWWLAATLNLIEDGGEMVVATVLVAYTTGAFLRMRQPAADTPWRDSGIAETPAINAGYSPASRRRQEAASP